MKKFISVRAGVIINVLFLSILFLLILEFYLTSSINYKKNILAQEESFKARIIYSLVCEQIKDQDKSAGVIKTNQGLGEYKLLEKSAEALKYEIDVKIGEREYQYYFRDELAK
jgi:hypothetical protein